MEGCQCLSECKCVNMSKWALIWLSGPNVGFPPLLSSPLTVHRLGFWLFHLSVAEHHLINNGWLIDFSLPIPSINPLLFFLTISSSHSPPLLHMRHDPDSVSSCFFPLFIFFPILALFANSLCLSSTACHDAARSHTSYPVPPVSDASG